MEQHILNICGAKPLTCFRSGQGKGQEGSDQDQPLAFRVCIDAKYSDKFMDPELWDDGIVIKLWRFKPKGTIGPNVNPNLENDK